VKNVKVENTCESLLIVLIRRYRNRVVVVSVGFDACSYTTCLAVFLFVATRVCFDTASGYRYPSTWHTLRLIKRIILR